MCSRKRGRQMKSWASECTTRGPRLWEIRQQGAAGTLRQARKAGNVRGIVWHFVCLKAQPLAERANSREKRNKR